VHGTLKFPNDHGIARVYQLTPHPTEVRALENLHQDRRWQTGAEVAGQHRRAPFELAEYRRLEAEFPRDFEPLIDG
jgi:hypothetical protein